jgi:hypothetical protein
MTAEERLFKEISKINEELKKLNEKMDAFGNKLNILAGAVTVPTYEQSKGFFNVFGENCEGNDKFALITNFFNDLSNSNLKINHRYDLTEYKDILKDLFGLENSDCYYIRKCYGDLAESIFKDKVINNYVILTGSPGIGKTLFIIYWLWYLLTQYKNDELV